MHVILVNKSGSKEPVILPLMFYFIGIHHEVSKQGWPAKGQHANQDSNSNNSVGDEKHFSLQLRCKNYHEGF
jgi:hypothetical protein